MGQLSEWDAVEAEVARIIAESPKPFTVETVAQIDDFLKYLRGRTIVPEVAKGYWSTLRVMWDHTSLGPLEIEVHGGHLEIYRFRENGEGNGRHLAVYSKSVPCRW